MQILYFLNMCYHESVNAFDDCIVMSSFQELHTFVLCHQGSNAISCASLPITPLYHKVNESTKLKSPVGAAKAFWVNDLSNADRYYDANKLNLKNSTN